MAKCVIFFIILSVLLTAIVGCEPAGPESVESPKGEHQKIEPVKAEPPEIETAKAEPPKIEPQKIETKKAEPPKIEPAKPETHRVEKPKVEPAKVEPQKPESSKVESVKAEPKKKEAEPSKTESQKDKPKSADYLHNKCAEIFNEYVNDEGMVDYQALKLKRHLLKALLDEFKELDPKEYNSWSKEDKIAFWINAYNIQMLKIIVDNYPIKASRWLKPFFGPNSIQHIKGIWDRYKFIITEEEFTLIEADRRIFRKRFSEPRVFFALSRASLSGPPLRNEPYYGKKLNKQLDDQVKKFLSKPLAFEIDREERIVYLSPLFEPGMYGKEFISKYGTDKKFKAQEPATRAVLNFLTGYLPKQDVDFLEIENYSVKYISYDWRLDDQQ